VSLPEHGELGIDNHLAERMLRAHALGREDYTFLGSDCGGRTAAVLYTMTGSCKHHDIDAFAFLRDILSRLPSMPPGTARRTPAGRLVPVAPLSTAQDSRVN
jgi:hypothetical protein